MNRTHIEQLPTEQLEKMLENTLSQDQPDEELVRQVLMELEQRSEAANIDDPAVQTAWRNYVQACEADKKQRTKQRAHIHRKWALGAIAASLALFLILAVAPQRASAESFWERLARWTDTVFAFINPSDEQENYTYTTDHPGLQQVYDAVTELGVSRPVVPMWIPEEYELEWLDEKEQDGKTIVTAKFKSEEATIVFALHIFVGEAYSAYTKDIERIVVVERAGVNHYIKTNDGITAVTWAVDNIECSIFIDGQENRIMTILDSIYEMEAG